MRKYLTPVGIEAEPEDKVGARIEALKARHEARQRSAPQAAALAGARAAYVEVLKKYRETKPEEITHPNLTGEALERCAFYRKAQRSMGPSMGKTERVYFPSKKTRDEAVALTSELINLGLEKWQACKLTGMRMNSYSSLLKRQKRRGAEAHKGEIYLEEISIPDDIPEPTPQALVTTEMTPPPGTTSPPPEVLPAAPARRPEERSAERFVIIMGRGDALEKAMDSLREFLK